MLPVFSLKLELSSLELSHVINVNCLNGNPIGSSHLCLLASCLGKGSGNVVGFEEALEFGLCSTRQYEISAFTSEP